MPSHQDRREPLPVGYQFGDGRISQTAGHFSVKELKASDREFRNAVRGLSRAFGRDFAESWAKKNAAMWNVIEGETFDSDVAEPMCRFIEGETHGDD